jgi:hypothetical protein
VVVNTFWIGVRWAKMGGEFEFCPMKCYQNVDVGNVSLKSLEFCPTDCVRRILDDAFYT